MICRGSVPEPRGKRACWLPAERDSHFKLCRRCHFHKVTEVLDQMANAYERGEIHPEEEILFTNRSFLQDLLHPAREQALLHLLASMSQHNNKKLKLLLDKFKVYSVFPILITKRIHQHQPGTRCEMYRNFMKDPTLFTSDTLPWNCWSCIAWVVKQKDERLHTMYMNHFGRYFSRLTYDTFQTTGSSIFVDYCISLYLKGIHHHIRILIDHFFHRMPLEEFTSFLTHFFQQPATLSLFYEKKEDDFLPVPLRDDIVKKEFRKKIKDYIKKKTDTYKEELMIVTCHPDRFFTWCLDIEDLQDFQ